MLLKSITTKNYRTLQDLTLTFSEHYCTISGRNNAGKSSVIRLLSHLFRERTRFLWAYTDGSLNYKEDKTQWVKEPVPIQVDYGLQINRVDDPALVTFIEKIASRNLTTDTTSLTITYTATESAEVTPPWP